MSDIDGNPMIPPEEVGSKRRWGAVAACWLLAGCAVVCASPLSDYFVAANLLIGPIDREGCRALALFAAVALCAASIYGSAFAVSRPPARTWVRITASGVSLATTGGLLLIAYPLLFIGALSFSTEYRIIGNVDGHEVVAEARAGLGQFPISVGIRDGWTVDFSRATGDIYTTRGPTLKGLKFHIEHTPGEVLVTYRPGPTKDDTEGVLRLRTTRSS